MTSFDQATQAELLDAIPSGRAEQMRTALGVFEESQMPSSSQEEWKWIDIPFDLADYGPALEAGEPISPSEFLTTVEASTKIVVVDGHVVSVEGDDSVVHRLAEIDTAPQRAVDPDRDIFAAAAAAFGVDGVWIRIPDGETIERPILVDLQAVTPGVVSFPRVVVELGSNSEAEVFVFHRSPRGEQVITVPDIYIDVSDAARLRFVEIQSLDQSAYGVVHERLQLGRDATGRLGQIGIGAAIGRLDLIVEHVGDGSSSEVVGGYFGEGDQTLDYRVVMNHSGKNTSSDVFLKGAVEDRSQSIFFGLLRIEEGATRTAAFETNRNLVLSEEAKAQSVPNLEILCDDVVCGHGSSVGPLEEDHLYYLMSRGVPRERAEQLLMQGFFREVLDRLSVGALGEVIERIFNSRFIRAQESSSA